MATWIRKALTRTALFVVVAGTLGACSSDTVVTFPLGTFEAEIASDGQLIRLADRESGRNYLAGEVPAPLLSLRVDGVVLAPSSARWEPTAQRLHLVYPSGYEAEVRIQIRDTHASLEVVAVSDTSAVELVIWGPYPTLLNEVIGETVGVVQGDGHALGLQALNPRTLGGYPWNENDAMPQLDIFESDDFSDLSEEGKRHVLYRVEAAKPDSFGSTLQAYTRNRSMARIIPNWRFDEYVAPAFHDGGVVGSRIALFASTAAEALNTIGAIEVAEGLPHPMLDGVWAKISPRAAQAYVIMPFSEKTADRALDVVEKAGMQILYHPDPFSSWGHFELRRDDFPNGIKGLKAVADRAAERGMRVGGHTLSNFIHPHDPYVSPKPDPRLARVGTSRITERIDARQLSVAVASPELFRAGLKSTLRTVQLGDELIQYEEVSEAAPWRLLRVRRGAFGTTASSHEADSEIALLADHGYRVFLTNPELTIEMARNLAGVFGEAGLRHISFDGLEGNRSTGMGNYGEILFAQSWFDALAPEAQDNLIVTASRTSHYFWHLYTRMNWGEPWYAGFRESQTEYRMKNQKYFQRNFMPGMLGWFSLRPETSLEDIEWMLARSAAYDAGYALSTSLEVLYQNGHSEEILDLLALWEGARLSGAFSDSQKSRMEDISKEFHLARSRPGTWTLFPVTTPRFEFATRERQPGEPAEDRYPFINPARSQPLSFSVRAEGGTLTGVALSLDGSEETRLDGPLREGETFFYRGRSTAIVYGADWREIRRIQVEPDRLAAAPGAHRLGFRAKSANGVATAKIELRLTGAGEVVSRDR